MTTVASHIREYPTRDPHTYTHRDRTARIDCWCAKRLATLVTSVYKYLNADTHETFTLASREERLV